MIEGGTAAAPVRAVHEQLYRHGKRIAFVPAQRQQAAARYCGMRVCGRDFRRHRVRLAFGDLFSLARLPRCNRRRWWTVVARSVTMGSVSPGEAHRYRIGSQHRLFGPVGSRQRASSWHEPERDITCQRHLASDSSRHWPGVGGPPAADKRKRGVLQHGDGLFRHLVSHQIAQPVAAVVQRALRFIGPQSIHRWGGPGAPVDSVGDRTRINPVGAAPGCFGVDYDIAGHCGVFHRSARLAMYRLSRRARRRGIFLF